jgi:hypothetical protein
MIGRALVIYFGRRYTPIHTTAAFMKASDALDLSKDNRIKVLLEERERQAAIMRAAKAAKEQADAEIREKLGDAIEAFTDDWLMTVKTVRRREFTVPAGEYQVLKCQRLEPPDEDAKVKHPRPGRPRKQLNGPMATQPRSRPPGQADCTKQARQPQTPPAAAWPCHGPHQS